MSIGDFVPYCGTAPAPGDLKWNLDPILLSFFMTTAAVYYAMAYRRFRRHAQLAFAIGWAVAAAALISPLCNLTVALFSARVTQHMVLTLIAAPLIVFAVERPTAEARPSITRSPTSRLRDFTLSATAFAVCIWVWHWPGPYDATLQNNTVYWLMHVTTSGSALWLWYAVLHFGRHYWGPALLAGFFTGLQMTLLGALLTFAGRSLFVVHVATTHAWGLSQLEDQQLGGLIMWVIGGFLFSLYGVVGFGVLLHRVGAARVYPRPHASTGVAR